MALYRWDLTSPGGNQSGTIHHNAPRYRQSIEHNAFLLGRGMFGLAVSNIKKGTEYACGDEEVH